jgi:hypothetical protein
MYSVLDNAWLAVNGSDNGVLCLNCFLELADLKGITITLHDLNMLALFNGDKSYDILK